MSDRVVCGIDVGSSAVKVTVLHPDRGIIGTGDTPSPLGSPQPGWSEVAITDWWDAVCLAIPRALAAAEIDAGEAEDGVLDHSEAGFDRRAGLLVAAVDC